MQHIHVDSSTCFAITNINKSLEQVKSGSKSVVGISLGMQGIMKTQEKCVQSNYLGHIIMPMIYDKCPHHKVV